MDNFYRLELPIKNHSLGINHVCIFFWWNNLVPSECRLATMLEL